MIKRYIAVCGIAVFIVINAARPSVQAEDGEIMLNTTENVSAYRQQQDKTLSESRKWREKYLKPIIPVPITNKEGEDESRGAVVSDDKCVVEYVVEAYRSDRYDNSNNGTNIEVIGTANSDGEQNVDGEIEKAIIEIPEEQQSPHEEITSEPNPEPQMEYLGDWTISFYCPCQICCGEWAGGPTASGVMPSEWWTAATDGLEFGTIVYVEGLGEFEIQDRGTDYGWLDIYVGDHQEALNGGLQTRPVYIVTEDRRTNNVAE